MNKVDPMAPSDTEPPAEPLQKPDVIHPIRMLKTKDYVTLAGMVFGVLAIGLAIDRVYNWVAGIFILAACGCDLLDGYIARRWKQINAIGGELDSLCDAISFAVAPGLLYYFAYAPLIIEKWGYGWNYGMLAFATAFFIGCGILRLAWFNVTEYSGYVGLVVPLAASFCVLYFWADVTYRALGLPIAASDFVLGFTPFFLIIIGIFMTSPFLVYDKAVKKKQGKTKYAIFFGLGISILSLVLGLIFREQVRVFGLVMLYIMIGLLVYYIGIGFRNWLRLRNGNARENVQATTVPK